MEHVCINRLKVHSQIEELRKIMFNSLLDKSELDMLQKKYGFLADHLYNLDKIDLKTCEDV